MIYKEVEEKVGNHYLVSVVVVLVIVVIIMHNIWYEMIGEILNDSEDIVEIFDCKVDHVLILYRKTCDHGKMEKREVYRKEVHDYKIFEIVNLEDCIKKKDLVKNEKKA